MANKYVMRTAGTLGSALGMATTGTLIYWASVGLEYEHPWRFLALVFFLQALFNDYRMDRAKEASQIPGQEKER